MDLGRFEATNSASEVTTVFPNLGTGDSQGVSLVNCEGHLSRHENESLIF